MIRWARSALTLLAILGFVGMPLIACAATVEPGRQLDGELEPVLSVGATFHGFWNYDDEAEAITALRTLKEAGGTWVRIDLGWEAVEPEPGEYSEWALEKYDAAIDMAHQEGLNVLLVFQLIPNWANGSDDSALAPRNVSDFGDFAVDVANRYAGKVQAVELWNEPNHDEFFKAREQGQEAQEHTAMVEDAYTKINESGPQGADAVTILAGGSAHVDVSWWKELYAAGIRDYTDVIAVNPYPLPSNLPPTAEANGTRYRLNELKGLLELMETEGDDGKPIWFTEFGWSDHPNYPDDEDWELGLTQDEQADYFEETIALLKSSYPEVERVFWYNLRDREDTSSLHLNNFGLLERDLTPKPVLERMAQVISSAQVDPSESVAGAMGQHWS